MAVHRGKAILVGYIAIVVTVELLILLGYLFDWWD
jgi:hypothetical protein